MRISILEKGKRLTRKNVTKIRKVKKMNFFLFSLEYPNRGKILLRRVRGVEDCSRRCLLGSQCDMFTVLGNTCLFYPHLRLKHLPFHQAYILYNIYLYCILILDSSTYPSIRFIFIYILILFTHLRLKYLPFHLHCRFIFIYDIYLFYTHIRLKHLYLHKGLNRITLSPLKIYLLIR